MPNKSHYTKDGFVDVMPSKKNLMNLCIILMGVSAAVYFLLALIWGRAASGGFFFANGGDFFMDAFNSIRDAAQGKEVYSERHVIYPPMANLIFLILSRFTDSGYNDTDFDARYSWKEYGSSMLFVLITLALCFIALFVLVWKATKRGTDNRRIVFAALMTLSVPILYMMERGNILILCVMACLVYAITYHSDSRVAREIGLLALAFAFSLKLYPVVFGWFLIVDKRYKDAIRCAIYGVAMLILPSFFFGGPIFCLMSLYENVTGWSSGSGNGIARAMQALNFSAMTQSVINALIYVWVLICAACFVLSSFFRPEQQWKTWAVGVATILCVPSLTGVYAWAFMLVPLILLVNRESATPKYIAYVTLMTIPFMYLPLNAIPLEAILQRLLPTVTVQNVSCAKVWNYVITAVVSIFLVTDTFVDFGRFLSRRKENKKLDETVTEASEV
ncbi:MAG: DUF2029 domain-containing protein [Ruminococcaceae bacterium]|nr:DUF2029 domain-containing protein [Oscillospiraceae bacterium]